MSGSVCNQGTGFECENCEPELVCNDVGLGLGTCCNNFLEVIEFTKSLVNSLSNIDVEQSYSLVGFGVDAEVAIDGVLPEDILISLDEIVYTGGRTNHAAAIDACSTQRDQAVSSLQDQLQSAHEQQAATQSALEE